MIWVALGAGGNGSRTDMRSRNRRRRGDVGVNAARSQSYFPALGTPLK